MKKYLLFIFTIQLLLSPVIFSQTKSVGEGVSDIVTLSSIVSGNLTFYNNQAGTFPLVTTEFGDTNPTPVKICADGSNATEVILYNLSDGFPDYLDIIIKEDPNAQDVIHYGSIERLSSTSSSVTFIYTHPQSVDNDNLYRQIHFQIINTANSNNAIYEHPARIYRTPVLMVHGLWSNKGAFENMENSMRQSYLPSELTLRLDYRNTNASSYETNLNVVKQGILQLKQNAISHLFSVGKVNVVAHSMGGILTRIYIQSDDFGDDICRFITLNTPHSGSQMADVLLENPSLALLFTFAADKNCYGGAVRDLMVNSDATLNYLNGDNNLNKNVVPSRVFFTTGNTQDLFGWVNILVTLLPYTVNVATNIIFDNHPNDFIVADISQEGGLSLSSSFEHQIHTGSPDNVSIIDYVKEFFDFSPNDTEIFTTSGFHPPIIDFSNAIITNRSYAGINSTLSGTVTINTPADGTEVMPGDILNVAVTSSGDVGTLFFVASNPTITAHAELEESTTSYTFQYQVPQEAVGRIKLSAIGFGDSGYVNKDSIFVNVNVGAQLDSLVTQTKTIYIYKGTNTSITIDGYFNDGFMRDLSEDPNVEWHTDDNSIAAFNLPGIITGVSTDTTNATISYNGFNAVIKIIVLPSDFFTSVESEDIYEKTIPTENRLLQNYPNPFNPSTTIKYNLNKRTFVTLNIYNILGKKVASLVKKMQYAGYYEVYFNAENLPSGIYFYQIVTDNSNLVKKMILLK